MKNVELTFKDGVVVDWAAEQGEGVIGEIIGTDGGSRQLGELGIGMNRGVDRVTDNILFDEKMGGTVHLALGRAYDACLPEGKSATTAPSTRTSSRRWARGRGSKSTARRFRKTACSAGKTASKGSCRGTAVLSGGNRCCSAVGREWSPCTTRGRAGLLRAVLMLL